MKKITLSLIAIIILSLLLTILSCKTQTVTTTTEAETTKTVETTTTIQSTSTETDEQKLSEQPDEAAFKEYFTELGLGKLPENGKLPLDIKKGDNVFVSNGKDELVIYGDLLKDTKLSNAVYDVSNKKYVKEKVEFPMVIKKGGFAGSEPVTFPAGKYEYKIWIGDKLVGVFPFEVKP